MPHNEFTVETDGADMALPSGRMFDAPSVSPLGAAEAGNPVPYGQCRVASAAPPDLIAHIQELQVRRKHHIKTTNRLTNAGGALVRRALGWAPDNPDAEKIKGRSAKLVADFLAGKQSEEDAEAIGVLSADLTVLRLQVEIAAKARREIELDMIRSARKLPVHAFAESVRGLGELGLAVIVGEAGDLAKYSKVDKLWKRLGLAPYNGRAMSAWSAGDLTSAEWVACGYSGRRRAEIFSAIGDPLFRAQSALIDKATGETKRPAGPYRIIFDRYKAEQRAKNDLGFYADRAREIVAKLKDKAPKANREGCLTDSHIHGRAIRYMTKALISDLWSAWTKAEPC